MGLSDLRDLAVIQDVSFDELTDTVVGVDFYNWLYRYITVLARFTDEDVYTTSDGEEVLNLLGIMKGVPTFLEHDITPVFVFDGEVLELKEDEMARRRERKEAAAERAEEAREQGKLDKAARLQAQAQRMTPTVIETSRELIDLLGFPIVDAPAEAEAQAAHMARQGDIDYVGSEDYDCLLFGAPYTLRQLTSNGDPECMDLEATLETHGITIEELVDIAVLCGTDYNDGVHGIGPKTGLKEVKAGKSVDEILASYDAEIKALDEIREIYLSPSVTDTYSVPPVRSPDLDEIRRYITEEWEIPFDAVETSFDRYERHT